MSADGLLRRSATLAIRGSFLLYLVLGLLGIGRLLQATGRPFGGFIWLREETHGFRVGFESGRTWGGRRAGLMLDDRIVRVDGRPIALDGRPDAIRETYRRARIGQMVDYEVERTGEPDTLHIRAPVERFTWLHLLEAYGPFYLTALTFWTVGLFVHLVNPDEKTSTVFALLCLAISGPLTFHNFSGLIHEFYLARAPLLLLYAPAWPLLNALGIHFFGIFPAPQPWWPRVRAWAYATALIIALLYTSSFAGRSSVHLQDTMLLATTLFTTVACVWGVLALGSAHRRSTSREVRQQVKICGIGFGIGLILPFLWVSSYILFRPYPGVWWAPAELLGRRLVPDWLVPLPVQMLLVSVSLPTSMAVAILRPRVFGAKPALVKTIAGTAILGVLVATYAVTVGSLQAFFAGSGLATWAERRLGASIEWAWLSNVVAVLATVILFPRLRSRIESGVTKLLYPHRITSSETLVQLIETVRSLRSGTRETGRGRTGIVPGAIADLLRDTLHLREVLFWFHVPALKLLQVAGREDVHPACLALDDEALACLRAARPPLEPTQAPPPLRPVCEALAARGVRICLPLVYRRNELVGLVTLGPRLDDVPFGPEDRQLLVDLTGYLLLLLKSERAIHDLRQSRERLSAAQESERRRIARELHDRTLQDLSYLATVQLERCRRALANPEQAGALIQETQAMAQKASAELRGILADVSPDVVCSRGLVAALEHLVESERQRLEGGKVEIVLDVSGRTIPACPQEVELAVYRYTREALLNAVRHAHARRIEVRLELADGALVAAVRDDGRGLELERLATALENGHLGLHGMHDRIETVGGRLSVESVPGQGTKLQAVIPLPK